MKAPDEVSPSKITWKKFERTTKQKLTPPLNSSDVWELATSIKERFPVITRPMGWTAAAAAKSLQSCPTLCDPRDGSPLGSPVPGILQARTLEWVAISFSNAWKWKVKVKSLSRVRLFATPLTEAYQAPLSMGFSRQKVLEWGAIAFSTGDA